MGELGRRFARVNRARLLKALTRAYADEWFAHYNYQFTANALWGHHSPSTIGLLSRKSADAFARTNRLAKRILELGGEPISKLTNLVSVDLSGRYILTDASDHVIINLKKKKTTVLLSGVAYLMTFGNPISRP